MSGTRASNAIINGAELDAMHFDPVRWIVPGIIPEGQTLLVAPPKAGKSWLVYAIAIAKASGGRVLGQQIQPGPVLYLALEDGWRRLQERGRKLLAAGETLPASLEFSIKLETDVLETVSTWLAAHTGQGALIVVDTLGKVKPPARAGASAYEHDYRVMSALKSVVDNDPGSGMVLVHHDRKAVSDDFLDAVSGTNALAGAADTTVVIGRARTEGEAILSVTGRDVNEAEYAARFSGGLWSLAGDGLLAAQEHVIVDRATANLGDRSAEIVQFVYQHPAGVSRADIEKELGNPAGIGVYLKRLVDTQRIAHPERGRYTPVTSVTSVTSVGDEHSKVTQVTDVTATCKACSYRLDPMLVEMGAKVHPGCEPDDSLNRPCGHPGGSLPPGKKCGTCLAERLNVSVVSS